MKDSDIRRAVMAIAAVPAATLPESPFLSALGPAARMVPPQTGSLAQRAIEEWKRNLCENKAVAILERMQAFFFSLEYGRCRTVARSLHEHKQ